MGRRRKLREMTELCGARLPMSPGRMQKAIDRGMLEHYLRRAGHRCRSRAMANGRCRIHGGMSTGPKTDAGKAKVRMNLLKGLPEGGKA